MVQPDEPQLLETYGPTKDMFGRVAQIFAEREYQDPQLVVDALVELAESDRNARPLRLPVGADSQMACTPINDAHDASQRAILGHFGFD